MTLKLEVGKRYVNGYGNDWLIEAQAGEDRFFGTWAGGMTAMIFNANGERVPRAENKLVSLIKQVPEIRKVDVWINVYPAGCLIFQSPGDAESMPGAKRIACIHRVIEIDMSEVK